MKKLLIGLLLVMCLLVPISCGRALSPSEGGGMPPVPGWEEAGKGVESGALPSAEEGPLMTMSDVSQPWAERMIIRTGDMLLMVNDVPITMNQITELADSFGGYVVSSKRWGEGERLAGSIAIRVPAEYFADAMMAIGKLAVEVTSESTSSKDVTEEYVDLGAKLQNLEATDEQLLQINVGAA
jgi:hypothetical protein